MSTRRDFFRAAVALPASWTVFTNALQAAGSDDSYWQMVQRQFPLDDDLIYLNAANVCPASRPVMDRHLAFLRDFQANPSFQNRAKYTTIQESLRAKAARMLRVSADEVAITRNTSEGSNVVVKGVDLKASDEVILTSHNHPSNLDSWKVRARRDGFTVTVLPVPVPAHSSDELFGAIEKAVTSRTKVIAVTHLTSTTGIQYPAREIAALARRRGIWMHLDGAQTFGAFDVNLQEIGPDSYSTSAHKWLMGPLESGLLYVRAERIPQLWPSIVTAGWTENLKGARKFEIFGQRDDPRVVALESALDFVGLIGMPVVEARVRALATHAKTKLQDLPQVELKTNMEPALSGGVIKFRLRNVPTRRAYDTLWERYRVSIAMTASGDSEGLRLSPHIYNSTDQIDHVVAAVRALA